MTTAAAFTTTAEPADKDAWDRLRATAVNAHLSPAEKRAQIERIEDEIGYGLTDEQKAERDAKRAADAKAQEDRARSRRELFMRLDDQRYAIMALDFYVLSRVAENDQPNADVAAGLSTIASAIASNIADIQDALSAQFGPD